jgi:anthranilate synthase component I
VTAAVYRPSRDEFVALARDHAVVPVWREVLADLQTPVAVYDRVRREGGPTFLLESVERGEHWGRHSFIGLRPLLGVRAREGRVTLDWPSRPPPALRPVAVAAATGDPLATLEAMVSALRAPRLEGLPLLHAGAVGYLGYDVVRFIERLPAASPDGSATDVARLHVPGQVIAFDHLRQRMAVVSNVLTDGDPGAQYSAAVAASERLVAVLGASVAAPSVPPPEATVVDDARANMTPARFLEVVRRCKEHIAAGDVFQVVPSRRFSLSTRVDPFAVYRVLRVINPSPYMFVFDLGDHQLVGSSPEALVTVREGLATIWPIAGSRPRGVDEDEDARLRRALLADDKERAEHVMLVDLARNDLGRISRLGTVGVTELMDVQRYSHVMHLVSRVSGRLRDGVGPVDVLRATFPAGTLTGAPKVRAMQLIDELEPTRRGVYGGGIGYVDFAGNLDLCIAIRTLVFAGGQARVQAGAGVVADSVPELELEETRNKAMGLLAAVRAAEALPSALRDPTRP